MFINHGLDDTNCPFQDSEEFRQLVQLKFPGQGPVHLHGVEKAAHAFDYKLKSGDSEVKGVFDKIMAAWPNPQLK